MKARLNRPARGVTVPEVLRDLNVEASPGLATSIGARVRERFRALHDAEPPKELRQKTGGGGSHCFAVYGPEMRPIIEEIIAACRTESAAQGRLPL